MKMFENILVVGAGTMGLGIAQVFATNGIKTTLVDQGPEQLDLAKTKIANNMAYLIQEDLATEAEAERTRTLITYETDLQKAAQHADLVVESVFENPEVKRTIFAALDKACSPECILASNTSAMNIFDVAPVSHPERMIITHWFNPPYIMPLVEVVSGPLTSDATVDRIKAFLVKLGKKPAIIKQYIPGFIVNRIANVISREAGYMIAKGWTTAEAIETALANTSGIRYAFEGPLALNDIVGWDLIQTVALDVHKTLCNDTEGGNALGAQLVAKGELGLKTGKGALDYTGVDPAQFMKERSAKIIKMIKVIKTL
jgi:3-hydroxybutyryl-CoA dehydrogenase